MTTVSHAERPLFEELLDGSYDFVDRACSALIAASLRSQPGSGSGGVNGWARTTTWTTRI